MAGGLVATLDGSTTDTNKLKTRQTLSTNYTEHIRPYDCRISPQNTPCTAERTSTSQKKEHTAKCVYCPDSGDTVEHFLLHCQLYDNIRSILLPAQPNIHNTLYASTTQRQRTKQRQKQRYKMTHDLLFTQRHISATNSNT